jgi:hypothetical protein
MSKIIGWDDIDTTSTGKKGGKGGGNDSKYLKLTGSIQGTTYRVRPVGDPCGFYAYYIANPDDPKRFNRAITEDPQNCIIRQKYNVEAKPRYAVNVIDRADGKLKIMEAPASVFEAIKRWAKASGQHPGNRNGADFEITVKIPASGDKKRTEYNTTPVVQTPFTDEEKAMLKEQDLWDLGKEFAPTPQSEIEEKLYPSKSKAPAQAASAPTAAPAKAASGKLDLGF